MRIHETDVAGGQPVPGERSCPTSRTPPPAATLVRGDHCALSVPRHPAGAALQCRMSEGRASGVVRGEGLGKGG
jgi:hypothetical protein